MSHTAKIDLKIKDFDVLKKVVKEMGLVMEEGTFRFFSSTETGIGVYLPGWKYPVVIKKDGTAYYDNYRGNWGDIKELYKLKNKYAIEKTKKEARKKGYSIKEERTKDGKTRLILRKLD